MGPADVPARAHVYVERLDDTITVDGDDGHHLARVRRLRAGEIVTAADGYGRWRSYSVAGVDAGSVTMGAIADFAHETPLVPALTLAFALTKGERPELAVQKLTELGADEILLVRSARSVVRWEGAREDHAIDRLRRIAREAGAQCRRARLPLIDGPVAVAELADRPGLVLADRERCCGPMSFPIRPTGSGSSPLVPRAASTIPSWRSSATLRASRSDRSYCEPKPPPSPPPPPSPSEGLAGPASDGDSRSPNTAGVDISPTVNAKSGGTAGVLILCAWRTWGGKGPWTNDT